MTFVAFKDVTTAELEPCFYVQRKVNARSVLYVVKRKNEMLPLERGTIVFAAKNVLFGEQQQPYAVAVVLNSAKKHSTVVVLESADNADGAGKVERWMTECIWVQKSHSSNLYVLSESQRQLYRDAAHTHAITKRKRKASN